MKKSSILGISFQELRKKKNNCVVCGDKVHEDENYLVAIEGHCHKGCVYKTRRKEVNMKEDLSFA